MTLICMGIAFSTISVMVPRYANGLGYDTNYKGKWKIKLLTIKKIA